MFGRKKIGVIGVVVLVVLVAFISGNLPFGLFNEAVLLSPISEHVVEDEGNYGLVNEIYVLESKGDAEGYDKPSEFCSSKGLDCVGVEWVYKKGCKNGGWCGSSENGGVLRQYNCDSGGLASDSYDGSVKRVFCQGEDVEKDGNIETHYPILPLITDYSNGNEVCKAYGGSCVNVDWAYKQGCSNGGWCKWDDVDDGAVWQSFNCAGKGVSEAKFTDSAVRVLCDVRLGEDVIDNDGVEENKKNVYSFMVSSIEDLNGVSSGDEFCSSRGLKCKGSEWYYDSKCGNGGWCDLNSKGSYSREYDCGKSISGVNWDGSLKKIICYGEDYSDDDLLLKEYVLSDVKGAEGFDKPSEFCSSKGLDCVGVEWYYYKTCGNGGWCGLDESGWDRFYSCDSGGLASVEYDGSVKKVLCSGAGAVEDKENLVKSYILTDAEDAEGYDNPSDFCSAKGFACGGVEWYYSDKMCGNNWCDLGENKGAYPRWFGCDSGGLSQEKYDGDGKKVICLEKFGASISVNTLKDRYGRNEFILLTDPLEDSSIELENNVVSSDSLGDDSLYESDLLKKRDFNSFENRDFNSFDKQGSQNYIIKLKADPLIKVKNNLEEEIMLSPPEEKSFSFLDWLLGFFGLGDKEKKSDKEEAGDVESGSEELDSAKFEEKIKLEESKDEIQKEIKKQDKVLEKEHTEAKEDIASILGGSVSLTGHAISDRDIVILNEFKNVFNGFVINLTEDDAWKLVEAGYKVYPESEYELVLSDSVPLINADDVWRLDEDGNNCEETGKECLTGKGVSIGIIDTGVDYTHGDLGGCFGEGCKVVDGYDFANDDEDPMDERGHGTHVAATAAGDGVLKGVAPDAEIYAYKVFRSSGGAKEGWTISAIERAVDPNNDGDFSDSLDIISMSLGDSRKEYSPLVEAVDNAVDSGVIAVVAAGNSGSDIITIKTPGISLKAITVGAVDKSKEIARFSSRGPNIMNGVVSIKPDVVAPGVSICAAQWEDYASSYKCVDDEHVAVSGTSMATPHVSGVVALMKQAKPYLTPKEIKLILTSSSDNLGISVNEQGHGFVNAEKAIQLLKYEPLIVGLEIEDNYNVKGIVEIKGEASGDDFDFYVLDYGKGFNPESWIEISRGDSVVEEGVLGSLDTSFLEDDFYVVRLRAFDKIGNEYKSFGLIKTLNAGNVNEINLEFGGESIAGDITGDGNEEIIVLGYGGYYSAKPLELWVFDSEGDVLPGWPREIDDYERVWNMNSGVLSLQPNSHILADTDGDGIKEIILSSGKTIYAFNSDGSYVEGYPIDFDPEYILGNARGSLKSGNFDKDEAEEILVFISDVPPELFNLPPLPDNWPYIENVILIIDDSEINVLKAVDLFSLASVVGDINKDGVNELIVSGSCHRENNWCNKPGEEIIMALDKEGNIMDGWPIKTGNSLVRNCGPPGSDAVCVASGASAVNLFITDFYDSGESNIIINLCASFDRDETPWDNAEDCFIRILDSRGNIIKSFATDLNEFSSNLVRGSMSLGDVDNDGFSEFILSYYGRISLFDKEGNFNTGNVNGGWVSSVIGDFIKENPGKEIVLLAGSDLVILDSSLEEIDRVDVPLLSAEKFFIGDFDNNGKADGLFISDTEGKMIIMNDLFEYRDDLVDWPMDGYDLGRTGCYKCELEGREQSKLINEKKDVLSGHLTMFLERLNVEGDWVVEKEIVSKDVEIESNGVLSLDKEWNPLMIKASGSGQYRIKAVFVNEKGMISDNFEFDIGASEGEFVEFSDNEQFGVIQDEGLLSAEPDDIGVEVYEEMGETVINPFSEIDGGDDGSSELPSRFYDGDIELTAEDISVLGSSQLTIVLRKWVKGDLSASLPSNVLRQGLSDWVRGV